MDPVGWLLVGLGGLFLVCLLGQELIGRHMRRHPLEPVTKVDDHTA